MNSEERHHGEAELARQVEAAYSSLTRADLQQGAPSFDEQVLQELVKNPNRDLYVGFYSRQGLELAFERYGLMDALRQRGYRRVAVEIRTDDIDEHLLRLHSVDPPLEAPLWEMVARRTQLVPRGGTEEALRDEPLPLLMVEWIQLQHPLGRFSAERPPLPGQRQPGLGLSDLIYRLLIKACERLGLHGLINVPSYFHNAVMYAERFRYFDPRVQGLFLALCRDLPPRAGGTIAGASWALAWEMVRDRRGGSGEGAFAFFHEPMISPADPALRAYFASERYVQGVRAALAAHRFEVLRGPFVERLAAQGIQPFDRERVERWIDEV